MPARADGRGGGERPGCPNRSRSSGTASSTARAPIAPSRAAVPPFARWSRKRHVRAERGRGARRRRPDRCREATAEFFRRALRQDRPAADRIVAPADTRGLPPAGELRDPAGVAAGVDGFRRARALSSRIACSVDLSGEERPTDTISDGHDDDDPHRIGTVPRREAEAAPEPLGHRRRRRRPVRSDAASAAAARRTARPAGPGDPGPASGPPDDGRPRPPAAAGLQHRRPGRAYRRDRRRGGPRSAAAGRPLSGAQSSGAQRSEPGGARAAGAASRCPGGNFFANPIRSDGARRAPRGLGWPPQTGRCGGRTSRAADNRDTGELRDPRAVLGPYPARL